MLNEGAIGDDPRVLPAIERAIEDFRKGVQYRDGKTFFLEISYENGKKIPGYLYLPHESKRIPGTNKIPILINSGGGDSTQEEIYFLNAHLGPNVGYAVLTFEGPGQGIVLRRDKLPMRPDWEFVVGKVLDHLYDFASFHPELDLDLSRVAISGASMGGYFALRAAADPRITACLCIDSFYSLEAFASGRMPAPIWKGYNNGWLSEGTFNFLLRLLQRLNFQARWEFNHLKWVLGEKTESGIMRRMQDFTLKKPDGSEYLADVKCPTLVTGAGASWYFDPTTTTNKIYDCLTSLKDGSEKEVWIARDIATGGLQAKVGAFEYGAQRSYAWLDKVWDIKRVPLSASGELKKSNGSE
jgi:pimeloyl-ACP methyl ester carboxylesterase